MLSSFSGRRRAAGRARCLPVAPGPGRPQPAPPGALPARGTGPGPGRDCPRLQPRRATPPAMSPLSRGPSPRQPRLTDLPIIVIIIFFLLPLQIQQHVLVLHVHVAEVAVPRARSLPPGASPPEPGQRRGRSGGGGRAAGRPPAPSRQEQPPPPPPRRARPCSAPAGAPGPSESLGLLKMCTQALKDSPLLNSAGNVKPTDGKSFKATSRVIWKR